MTRRTWIPIAAAATLVVAVGIALVAVRPWGGAAPQAAATSNATSTSAPDVDRSAAQLRSDFLDASQTLVAEHQVIGAGRNQRLLRFQNVAIGPAHADLQRAAEDFAIARRTRMRRLDKARLGGSCPSGNCQHTILSP